MFMPQKISQHLPLLLCILVLALLAALPGCDLLGGEDNGLPDDGMVRSVEKAPVAPDGDVAGRTTDLLLNLDVSMDPSEQGVVLQSGDQIRVILPDAFVKTADLPLLDIFACLAENLQCDTAVLLLGWPQGALGAPPPIGYEVRYDGSHTIVITATQDFMPNPPTDPGLKQVHLLLNSFKNPTSGSYPIGVELMTDEGVTHGIGQAQIVPQPTPSIAVTNALHENFANGNFQETSPGTVIPLPFDFLLWDGTGAAFEGVTIEGTRLMRGGEVIGHISIEAPTGAAGQEVFAEAASTRLNAPVTGIPVGHLRAFFRAGSEAGTYRITFALSGGNAVEMVVRVR